MSLDGHQWSTIANIPRPRLYFTSVLIGEKLFLLGGCDQRGETVSTVECYNFATQQWQLVKDMTERKAAPTAVQFDEKLFLFGGVGPDAKATNSVEYLDLGAEQWIRLPSLPEKLQGISAQKRGDKTILVGGMMPNNVGSSSMYCFDPTRGTIQCLPAMPTRRSKTGSFLVDNKLFVVGGMDGQTPVSALEMFDFRAFKWMEMAKRNSPPRVFESYLMLGDKRIACVGGLNAELSRGFSTEIDIFSLESGLWSTGAKMPEPRGEFANAWFRDRLIAAGGFGNQGRPVNTVCVYDPEEDSWTSLSSMMETHASCGSVADESKFCVIGGMSMTVGYSPLVEVFSLN